MNARAVALAAWLVVGCGGAPSPEPAAPAKLDVPKLPVPPPTRDASEGIRQHWPFDDGVRLAVYADVDAMMKMELFRALAQIAEDKCLSGVLEKTRELAAGADERGFVVIARFSDPLPDAALRTCTSAIADDRRTLAVAPPLAFYGDRALVEAAQRGATGPWPPSLSIAQDQMVSWLVKSDDAKANGGVHASNERFRVDAMADVPEGLGELLEKQIGRGMLPGPLANALKVERQGRRLSIVFELREPPVDQARDLGMLGAIAAHGVRAYIAKSKAAEAKNTVAQIARTYVMDWEREGKPRAKRRLVSYPPVPDAVPRGTAHASTEKDWAAWRPLHFEMSGPQRYQYEIVAAKDGESAEILARGDLNGDGRTSLFRVKVQVDRAKDTLVVAPTIEEIDPDE